MRKTMAPLIIGLFNSLLGLEIIIGWLLKNPGMVTIIPGSAAINLNSAFLFFLTGLVFILEYIDSISFKKLTQGIGAIIAAGSALILVEHIFNISLGIDCTTLHQTIQKNVIHPGRVPQNVCLSYFLTGIFFVIVEYLSPQLCFKSARWLTSIVIALSLFGFSGYLLHMELFYAWFQYNLVPLPAALALIVTSTGIWRVWGNVGKISGIFQEEDHMTTTGAFLLVLTGISAGLSGLMAFENQFLETSNSRIAVALKSQTDVFETTLDQTIAQAHLIAARPDLAANLSVFLENPQNRTSLQNLQSAANEFIQQGFSSIRFYLPKTEQWIAFGQASEETTPSTRLHTSFDDSSQAYLLWNHQFVLKNQIPIYNDTAQILGVIVMEYPLSMLTHRFYDTASSDTLTALKLCFTDKTNEILCFPDSLNGTNFVQETSKSALASLMNEVSNDPKDLTHASQYSGEHAITAYAPVGHYGLGISSKLDTHILYKPVRTHLQLTVALVLTLIVTGSILLRMRIKPFVLRLMQSEEKAINVAQTLYESEERLRTITDNLPASIAYIAREETVEFINKTYESWYNAPKNKIIGKTIQQIVGDDDYKIIKPYIDQVLSGYSVSFEKQSSQMYAPRFTQETYIPDIKGKKINGFYVMSNDISDRKLHEENITHMAQHDALTGLANRALFHERLKQAMTRSQRNFHMIALLYMDIDRFKSINDTLGHAIGDELLKQFSSRLAKSVRSVDTVARLGGDEFTVIMEAVGNAANVDVILNKLLAEIRQPFNLDGQFYPITSSIGVAFFNADTFGEDELLRRADSALYESKRGGRNRFTIYTGENESVQH